MTAVGGEVAQGVSTVAHGQVLFGEGSVQVCDSKGEFVADSCWVGGSGKGV